MRASTMLVLRRSRYPQRRDAMFARSCCPSIQRTNNTNCYRKTARGALGSIITGAIEVRMILSMKYGGHMSCHPNCMDKDEMESGQTFRCRQRKVSRGVFDL